MDDFDAIWAFDYALPPDYIYPFIFDGSEPYAFTEIDTSSCELGKMYVYDKNNDTLSLVTDEICTTYDGTFDHLYYVTNEQRIFKADYSGSEPVLIYESEGGEITHLITFG